MTDPEIPDRKVIDIQGRLIFDQGRRIDRLKTMVKFARTALERIKSYKTNSGKLTPEANIASKAIKQMDRANIKNEK